MSCRIERLAQAAASISTLAVPTEADETIQFAADAAKALGSPPCMKEAGVHDLISELHGRQHGGAAADPALGRMQG